MPALVNAVRVQQVVVGGNGPAVVNATTTTAAIDISAYEGQIAITELRGAIVSAYLWTTTLTFSATSGGTYAGTATYGNMDFTPSMGDTVVNTVGQPKGVSGSTSGIGIETIYVDTNAVPGFLKIVSTKVSGTSAILGWIVTGVKKVQ